MAFGGCPRWCCCRARRSLGATAIPGVRYDRSGVAEPDHTYTYAEAVREGICRQGCFVAYDGTLSWRSGDDVIESSFETVLSAREPVAGTGPRSRLSCPTGCRGSSAGRASYSRCGAMRTARRWVSDRGRFEPRPPDRRAVARVHRPSAAGGGPRRAAPRAEAGRVHALTRPLDRGRQHGLRGRRHPAAAGRRVRDCGQNAAGVPSDRGAVRADDPRPAAEAELAVRAGRSGAAQTRRRYRGRAAPRAGPARGRRRRVGVRAGQRVARSARRSPRSSRSAPTSPQMSLFGPPPGSPQGVRVAPVPVAAGFRRTAPTPTSGRPSSAGPRCSERHRLVFEVTRGTGPTTARSTPGKPQAGIKSVEKATVEELERSVELLVSRLTKRR